MTSLLSLPRLTLATLALSVVCAAAGTAGCAKALGGETTGIGGSGGGTDLSSSSVGFSSSTGFGSSSTGEPSSTSGPSSSAEASSSSHAASSGAGTSSSNGAGSSSSSGGGSGCDLGHLVISQIRSHGPGGAGDEFIELYNATPDDVTLDANWKVDGKKVGGTSYTTRWKGTGNVIPAHGHYLLGGTAYTQSPSADELLSSGVTDATNVRLIQGTDTVDAVCYYAASGSPTDYDSSFSCEGTPVSNAPHADASSDTADVSLVRKPGGSGGNCTDTDDNASDFTTSTPADPRNSQSAPTP